MAIWETVRSIKIEGVTVESRNGRITMSSMIPTTPLRGHDIRDQSYAKYDRECFSGLDLENNMEALMRAVQFFKEDSLADLKRRGIRLWWETY